MLSGLAFDPEIDEEIYDRMLLLVMSTSYQPARFLQARFTEEKMPIHKAAAREELKTLLATHKPNTLGMNFLVYWASLLKTPDEDTINILIENGAEAQEKMKNQTSVWRNRYSITQTMIEECFDVSDAANDEKIVYAPLGK